MLHQWQASELLKSDKKFDKTTQHVAILLIDKYNASPFGEKFFLMPVAKSLSVVRFVIKLK